MKKYVWSETRVEGGKPFTGTLAHPPSNTGAFQNLGIQDLLAAPEGPRQFRSSMPTPWSSPIAAAASDVPVESLHPKMTASGGSLTSPMLTRWRSGEDDQAPHSRSAGESAVDPV